eukprot:COSAG06_NODE_42897_length_377_cov_0.895683_1_plen_86_part_10
MFLVRDSLVISEGSPGSLTGESGTVGVHFSKNCMLVLHIIFLTPARHAKFGCDSWPSSSDPVSPSDRCGQNSALGILVALPLVLCF